MEADLYLIMNGGDTMDLFSAILISIQPLGAQFTVLPDFFVYVPYWAGLLIIHGAQESAQ